jgi:ferredoxin
MRVVIDENTCTGHGRCYSLAPQVFAADEFGNGTVLVEELTEELMAQATIGVQNCPERAISIEE